MFINCILMELSNINICINKIVMKTRKLTDIDSNCDEIVVFTQ